VAGVCCIARSGGVRLLQPLDVTRPEECPPTVSELDDEPTTIHVIAGRLVPVTAEVAEDAYVQELLPRRPAIALTEADIIWV